MKSCILVISLFFSTTTPVLAQDIFLTVKRQGVYSSALNDLTIAIANHRYTLIKIQPVDKGLRRMGYHTRNYKVLFFGDKVQVDQVLKTNPEAAVMLPLRIILYQKGDTVVASTHSLELWKGVFGARLNPLIEQWEQDVRGILQEFAGQQAL